jgi:hypothetical protein
LIHYNRDMRIFHTCTRTGLLENAQIAVRRLVLQISASEIRKVV